MPSITRQVAAVAAALALSAGPALASSTPSSTGAVNAKTSLTAEIAKQTPLFRVEYTLDQDSTPVSGPTRWQATMPH